jgi:hypothetical protein
METEFRLRFNMVSGWTPINHPIIQTAAQNDQAFYTFPADEDVPTSAANTKRPRTLRARMAEGDKLRKRRAARTRETAKRKKGSIDIVNNSVAQICREENLSSLPIPIEELSETRHTSSSLYTLKHGDEQARLHTITPNHLVPEIPSSPVKDDDNTHIGSQTNNTSAAQMLQDLNSIPRLENFDWSESTLATNVTTENTHFSSDDIAFADSNHAIDEYSEIDDAGFQDFEYQLNRSQLQVFRNDHCHDKTLTNIDSSCGIEEPIKELVNHAPDILGQATFLETSDLQLSVKSAQLAKPTDSLNALHKPFKSPLIRKPIVRPSFPSSVRDRSPVIGISSSTVLRTCFRIGEAINVGSRALRENKDIIIELFARVEWSNRESDGVKQHFQLVDLYHDRPPFLNAIYDLWNDCALWEHDSSVFLERTDQMMICRCIGRMKKDEERKLVFHMLNVWKASWKNVDFTKGIVCGVP